MSTEHINYSALIDAAMRGVVRDVLRQVERSGLPGEHHFYITFNTTHAGAKLSEALRARYPQEMTVVLQHQFWDFHVSDGEFTVTLSFGGVPEKIVIPFAALTAFADPSTKFGLQFYQIAIATQDNLDPEAMTDFSIEIINEAEESLKGEPVSAEIISLDTFRKK